jgi:hypothetical protein
MARDFGALVVGHVDDAGIALESWGGLLLLGMIIMSLSIISMLIFVCGRGASGGRGGSSGDGGGGCGACGGGSGCG